MNIKYRQFKPQDGPNVAGLIRNLYAEDPSDRPMLPEKIAKTFDALTRHPDLGTIIVLENEDEIVGYSIIINFWSNEYGGNVSFIDELYIKKEFRAKGIGTNFIKYLAENKFKDAVALRLEVTQNNKKAQKLYESLGFKLHKNLTLNLDLKALTSFLAVLIIISNIL